MAIRWEHHQDVPKGKKCRGHRGGQERHSGRMFRVEGAVGDLLAVCGRHAHNFRGKSVRNQLTEQLNFAPRVSFGLASLCKPR